MCDVSDPNHRHSSTVIQGSKIRYCVYERSPLLICGEKLAHIYIPLLQDSNGRKEIFLALKPSYQWDPYAYQVVLFSFPRTFSGHTCGSVDMSHKYLEIPDGQRMCPDGT
jgi:hypothetical protein